MRSHRGEGGEQGPLCAVSDRLLQTERLLSWKTCVSSAAQTVSPTCVVFSKKSCGIILEFRCITEDPSVEPSWTAAAHIADPTAIVWRGDPSLLGSLGHPEYVQPQLRLATASHLVSSERTPCVPDLHTLKCAGTRAACVRSPLNTTEEYAVERDGAMRHCPCPSRSPLAWSLAPFALFCSQLPV